jgi:hypothetical protein
MSKNKKCGTQIMKCFNARIVFQTSGATKEAEDELRAAGYETKIIDVVGMYLPATVMEISRLSEVELFDQVEAIIDPLDGFIEEGILEEYERWEARQLRHFQDTNLN